MTMQEVAREIASCVQCEGSLFIYIVQKCNETP